jgi:hypothetical protein
VRGFVLVGGCGGAGARDGRWGRSVEADAGVVEVQLDLPDGGCGGGWELRHGRGRAAEGRGEAVAGGNWRQKRAGGSGLRFVMAPKAGPASGRWHGPSDLGLGAFGGRSL